MEKLTPDKIFLLIIKSCALGVFVLVVVLCVTLIVNALPVFRHVGISFFMAKTWDPLRHHYGALPFLAGTLITAFLGLIMSLPFSLSIAFFLGEYFTSGKLSVFFQSTTDLLAGIPSVIYGFWGLFVLTPIMQKIQIKLGVMPYGVGIMTASVILAIMIIPYTASVAREVISLVPKDLKEAAYALGATRWEVLRNVVFPYAHSGILAGVLLALGRAVGETMAVTMVIGNRNEFPRSIFDPANTMASVVANEFAEAADDIYLAALIAVALLLFIVTTFMNILGRVVIKRFTVREL